MMTVPKPSDMTATYDCTYDAWNRLVEVKLSGTSNVVLKCEYDGLSRRIKKHINTSVEPDTSYDVFRHFYYDSNWRVLETRESDGENTAPETLQPEYQYVWSLRYIDAPILRDENTDADDVCDDERLYYCTDANMNVTSLVDASDGSVVERYVYDAYGKPTIYNSDWSATVTWANSEQNEILYAGYRYDPETGLFNVRYRYYHPTLGRWVSRDPAGYIDGMSLYEYVGGSPVNAYDPYGLWYKKRVLYVDGDTWQDGQAGIRTLYQEVWGKWYEREWMAMGEGKSREWSVFVPYSIQPPATKERGCPLRLYENTDYLSKAKSDALAAAAVLETTKEVLVMLPGGETGNQLDQARMAYEDGEGIGAVAKHVGLGAAAFLVDVAGGVGPKTLAKGVAKVGAKAAAKVGAKAIVKKAARKGAAIALKKAKSRATRRAMVSVVKSGAANAKDIAKATRGAAKVAGKISQKASQTKLGRMGIATAKGLGATGSGFALPGVPSSGAAAAGYAVGMGANLGGLPTPPGTRDIIGQGDDGR